MKTLLLASLLALTAPAFAQNVAVDVKDAWARPTMAQQSATGAYMKLTASRALKAVS